VRVVTKIGEDGSSTRTAMRIAVRRLLDELDISQSELARQLTQAAREHGLRRGNTDKEMQYDPAMVNRWGDGKLVMSRHAAWLIDHLYPGRAGVSFQDLRDSYLLANDRQQLPDAASVSAKTLLGGATCGAEALANRLPHRSLDLGADEIMAVLLLSVVDVEEARLLIDELVTASPDVRVIAMYDVLGHWDVAVKLAAPAGFDIEAYYTHIHEALVANEMAGEEQNPADDVAEFTRHRFLVTDVTRIRRPGSALPPNFIVLDSADDYDLYRVQRAFLFIELRTVPEIRRTIAMKRIEKSVHEDLPETCRRIVEAITFSDDAVILEIVMTCANGMRRLNQLNRIIGRELTRFKAQKYNLTVFETDERGWSPSRT
jgi:hypothetical protein